MTPNQLVVQTALSDLQLEQVEQADGPLVVGGPTVFEVTEETLKFLKGKKVTVNPDGSIEVN